MVRAVAETRMLWVGIVWVTPSRVGPKSDRTIRRIVCGGTVYATDLVKVYEFIFWLNPEVMGMPVVAVFATSFEPHFWVTVRLTAFFGLSAVPTSVTAVSSRTVQVSSESK